MMCVTKSRRLFLLWTVGFWIGVSSSPSFFALDGHVERLFFENWRPSGKHGPCSCQRSLYLRGGAGETHEAYSDDNERYSRQVYTLGARAHGLVRTSTIYVDGPPSSGLVYECAKNLALSGVGKIVLCRGADSDSSGVEAAYFDETLDDLGKAYLREALEELNVFNFNERECLSATKSPIGPEEVLAEYIRRLNPAVSVTQAERALGKDSSRTCTSIAAAEGGKGVVLCVDRPYETQVRLNQDARRHNIAFVAVETAGVYGKVFSDFGPNFQVIDADGEVPLVIPLDRVEVDSTDEGELLLVFHTLETEKHDVSKGDRVQIRMYNGEVMETLFTVVRVLTPQRVKVKVDRFCLKEKSEYKSAREVCLRGFAETVSRKAASFSRVKIPRNVSFVSLEEAMQKAKGTASTVQSATGLFTPADLEKSFDEVRRSTLLACFQALSAFVYQKRGLPTTRADHDTFQQLVTKTFFFSQEEERDRNEHIRKFAGSCAAKLAPLQSLFGALAAQEALKAVTGLYNPIKQILLYDCDELLPPSDEQNQSTRQSCEVGDEWPGNQESSKRTSARTGVSYILGEKIEKCVKTASVFVVGAGAIGCELLKNLAALGVGTGKKGSIFLTDMDTIERSNLSRQFLFRDSNVGDFKSIAARAAVLRMNPAIHIEAYTIKVGEGVGPLDESFWSSAVDVVLNALDNVEARLLVDQECVANKKALVDAGTLGSKGNVQVVIPHQSESYGCSVDPPEPAIPVCTLKNFPYSISHTIQWGLDLFHGLYQRRPRQANSMRTAITAGNVADVVQTLVQDLGEAAAGVATELAEDLSFASSGGSERENAIEWAAQLATRLFHDSTSTLLKQHPPESLDEDGEPFWGGTRKLPRPLLFSATSKDDTNQVANANLLAFVRSAARLRLEMLFGANKKIDVTVDEAREALQGIQISQSLKRETQDTEAKLLHELQSIPAGDKKTLVAVQFEKDDAWNGHVQFVTAASNLRAICYGIPPVDAMETRRVAGRIVPAMVTTSALVSALSCVEMLKLLQGAPLASHRNAFINLALPFFAFTLPVRAQAIPGPNYTNFTMWDNIVIRERAGKDCEAMPLTLKRFIRALKKGVGDYQDTLEVSTVSYGEYLIYANFLHGEDGKVLQRSIWDLVEEASTDITDTASAVTIAATSNAGMSRKENKLELTVTVEDTTGMEYELPPVHIYRASRKS